jgi:hypothetical protein
MTTKTDEAHRWSTSSFGGPANTSPAELSALEDHVGRCAQSRGRWFALRCAAENLNCFLAPRIVTLLVAGALLIALLVAAYAVS